MLRAILHSTFQRNRLRIFSIFTILVVFPSELFAQNSGEKLIDYGWMSLVPALVAIGLALLTKEVISSLLVGIISGLVIIASHSQESFLSGILLDPPILIKNALADPDHMSVVLFSLFIGAMVHIISKNGAMMAMVKIISKKAKDARSGQLATFFLGLAIFFDDYANSLVVGNTMRPVTDKLKISREKLAYIVDSTAAPIASVALITTWIGAELGYIQEGLDKVSQQGFEMGSAYGILINSLSYAFYPLLTIFFMFLIIWKQKDFGPMLKAEKAARKIESKMDESAVTPLDIDEVATDKERVVNAIIPIAVLIFGTMAALFYTGSIGNPWQNDHGIWFNLSNWVGASDSYSALLWSSFSALVIAVILTVAQRIHSLGKTLEYAIEGIKIMIPAIAILALAWSLAAVTDKINTAEYLSSLLGSDFRPEFLPAITFVLAALISFATGTSWGTMAILYPLVLFTSYSISVQAGLDEGHVISIYANVVSCVLAGSVLGDHCSPISDTTILSSLASSCNHVSHVRTQLPYALTVGIVSVLLGTLPSAFGIHPLICFAGAMICIYAIVSYFGKMAEG